MKALSKSHSRRLTHQKPKTILRKRNLKSTSPNEIVDQMTESRALPIGRKEFEEWSERIISGTLIKHDPDVPLDTFKRGQKVVLANMIVCLGPTESHKPDAHFIHGLRKAAANQTAHTIGMELRHEAKAALEEAAEDAGCDTLARAAKESKAHKEMSERAVGERVKV